MRFGFCSGRVAGLTLLLVIAVTGTAGELPSGPRLRLEKTGDSPWPADVGTAEVWPCWPRAARFNLCTADGSPVHWQTVWTAAGEPTLIRFDTSTHAPAFYVVFDTNAAPVSGSWSPEAGVVVETRRCKEATVNTLDQVSRLVTAAEVSGRSFVPDIFLGVNPHGPSVNYAALFSGWFRAAKGGDYEFATVSSGPSYLQVDGRLVAEWLGRHDPHGGRRAEHSGRIPLKAGAHHLEYVQVQFDGEPAAVAAWRPPDQDRFEVIPASAFVPVARFHATRFEAPASADEQLYCEWSPVEHCRLGEFVIVKMRFRALDSRRGRNLKWGFDDGAEAGGAETQHFFLQTGTHPVRLEARDGNRLVATNLCLARVNPRWSQREDWRQNVFDEARQDFLRREPSRLLGRDLVEMLELAERLEDTDLLNQAGERFLQREQEFTASAYAPIFYRLGLSFQHQGDNGNRLAEKALRLAATLSRSTTAIAERARLRIADLLIHCDGPLSEAQQLLAGLPRGGLTADERRLARLLEGDLLLAQGKAEEARKHYAAIGQGPPRAGDRPQATRAAQLESLSILIERRHYQDAEQQLDRFAFDAPLERLAPDVAWLRVQLSLRQGESRRAFSAARAALQAVGRVHERSALLGTVVETGLAIGRTDEAERALRELLRDFPYSEAAAKAKERWNTK